MILQFCTPVAAGKRMLHTCTPYASSVMCAGGKMILQFCTPVAAVSSSVNQCHVCRSSGQMVTTSRVAAIINVCCMCVDDLSLRKEVG